MAKKQRAWIFVLICLLAFAVQGCLGIGGPNTKNVGTNSNGKSVSVVQDAFKGKIYATIGHVLYRITGDGQSQQLVGGGNIYDPAVSPDGTKIAFIQRYKEYSDLAYVASSGGQVHVLLSGNGKYFFNSGGFVHSTYHWLSEPAWSPDGSTLIFLSDWMKAVYQRQCTGADADMLDLQVFTMQINNPNSIQAAAYAEFGGGGDQDPSYRPGHADQILYAHYSRLPSDASNQVVQLFLADPGEIARHLAKYCMGGRDSGVAISDPKDGDIQPAFSPDGNTIAYVRRDNATQMSLYVMPIPENVTQKPNDPATAQLALQPYQKSQHILQGLAIGHPVWSPSGKQIAYLLESNNELDLWIANLSYNASTGVYSLQGTPIQATTGGIDGDSRVVWTS
jgi:dipeptidyl aminopeptidase/acylaminoacyl peptidase